MELYSGERQVAPTVDGIRRDHVARYEWAAKSIPKGSRVIDFACGIGYGCKIMADAGLEASGFDRSQEAIAYAEAHYSAPLARFSQGDGKAPESLGKYDAAVCFETIEHIEDPRPLLKALYGAAPLLLASVPNEDVMPWRRESDGATLAFHFRHYTKAEFTALLEECGWSPVEWYGQEGRESDVEPDVNGRTLIAICKRTEVGAAPEDGGGKHIAILGLGPSVDQYLDYTKRLGGRSAFCDEVWAINALGNVLDCDLVFHMDDIRVQERRAVAAPESNIAAMVRWLKTSRVPVVTSRAHPDYPALVEFPLEDVLNNLEHDYFNSTAAYAVAFAIHIGATKISCFGFDFTYANSHQAEKGRACVEFWLGVAKARGIKLSMPKTTTLMDAMSERKDRLYGYDTLDVIFDIQEDGSVKLQFKPLDEIPTAAEMEKRYDHTAHPNSLVARAAERQT
jgi:SAM-dependent methyltransferase